MKTLLATLLCLVCCLPCRAQLDLFDHKGEGGVEIAGDYTRLMLPAAGLIGSLAAKDYRGTLQFGLGCATNLALSTILKYAVDKPRPHGNGSRAFPSGHVSIAFQGAAFIQRRYGWKFGIPAYALAAFTGWTRLYAKQHDIWDVLAGAAIGVGSSYIFTRPYKKRRAEVVFAPSYAGGAFRLYAGVSF